MHYNILGIVLPMLVNQSVTYVGELDHVTAQAAAKRRPGLYQE
jgi:hypothetical protein